MAGSFCRPQTRAGAASAGGVRAPHWHQALYHPNLQPRWPQRRRQRRERRRRWPRRQRRGRRLRQRARGGGGRCRPPPLPQPRQQRQRRQPRCGRGQRTQRRWPQPRPWPRPQPRPRRRVLRAQPLIRLALHVAGALLAASVIWHTVLRCTLPGTSPLGQVLCGAPAATHAGKHAHDAAPLNPDMLVVWTAHEWRVWPCTMCVRARSIMACGRMCFMPSVTALAASQQAPENPIKSCLDPSVNCRPASTRASSRGGTRCHSPGWPFCERSSSACNPLVNGGGLAQGPLTCVSSVTTFTNITCTQLSAAKGQWHWVKSSIPKHKAWMQVCTQHTSAPSGLHVVLFARVGKMNIHPLTNNLRTDNDTEREEKARIRS